MLAAAADDDDGDHDGGGGGRENRSKVHIELCCVLIYLMDESSKAH